MTVTKRELYPAAGFPPGIGHCLSALEEVREQLRDAVKDLPDDHVGRRALKDAHPIGALILHLGEAEWWWIQSIVMGNEMTDDDKRIAHWDVLEDPDGFASKGYSAQYCIDAVDLIRKKTHETLASFSDDDLDRIFVYESPKGKREVSLRWVLHHLVDHEAQHKGQILMLKRMLGRT